MMNGRVTLATAERVLRQVRHDPRTIALLLLVPCLLLVLLYYVFGGGGPAFERIGAPLCGLFPFILMFLITSIAMLRERTTGTLERLMTLPLARLDLLLGYGIAFGALAVLQAVLVSVVGFVGLGIDTPHGAWSIGALAVGNALLGTALGLFVSAFARSEFQAIQFLPAFIFPQMLVCGLFMERERMDPVLEAASWALPLTYAFDALERVAQPADLGGRLAVDVAVIAVGTLVALGLGAATLRRRTP